MANSVFCDIIFEDYWGDGDWLFVRGTNLAYFIDDNCYKIGYPSRWFVSFDIMKKDFGSGNRSDLSNKLEPMSRSATYDVGFYTKIEIVDVIKYLDAEVAESILFNLELFLNE